jgi:hypothetical protein
MPETIIYVFDQDSIQRAHHAMLVAEGFTALAGAMAYGFFGWRGWWLVLCSAIAIPNIPVLILGSALSVMSALDFVVDIVLPNAILSGLPSALTGAVLGAAGRGVKRALVK